MSEIKTLEIPKWGLSMEEGTIALYGETVIFLNFRNELQNLWSFTSFLLASILNAFFFAWLN
jgi:hypothetical protein